MKKSVIGIAIASLVLGACGRIETGNVGVRTEFNKTVNTAELGPGWYGAFLTSVDEFTTKETEVQMNDMRPKAKDNLSIQDMDVSIWYRTNPGQVADQVVKYVGMHPRGGDGLYYPSYNLVERYTRGAIYDVVAQFDSLTIHQKRNVVEEEIKKRLQADLNEADPEVFEITKVVVRQLLTDPSLEASIQKAVQVQKQIEAKNQEIQLARAEAERKRVEADGEAVANRIIANSITNSLLQLRQIEAMAKFADGKEKTVVLPSGATPLINIK